MDMKIIFAAIVAASVLLSSSSSVSQTATNIPMVNFICVHPYPLFDIMDVIYNHSPEEGRALANNYIKNKECWYVPPTPIEVINILQEEFDPKGQLWAIVTVKPHKITGFDQRLQRFSVIDAAIAKAYLARHQKEI